MILTAIAAFIVLRLASNKKKLDEKNKPLQTGVIRIPVKADTVKQQLLEIGLIKAGNLAPFKEAKVLAATNGTLLQVCFNLGDHVSRGQVLAVTDTRNLQLELQKAETNVAKLRSDLNTYTELLKGNAATREQVNNIRQDYTNAVTQAGQAQKNLTDAYVKAPTSGIISTRPVEEGVFVNAGTEIATIVNLSKAKVRVYLTETEVYKVTEGQKVKITTDVYPGKVFNGEVSFISPQADQARNYLVEIQIDNTQAAVLRSGTFIYTDFSRKTGQQVLVVPREAIIESVNDARVYIIEKGIAKLKTIRTGAETGGLVAVTGGIKKGDQVITSGQINIKDGSPVRISN